LCSDAADADYDGGLAGQLDAVVGARLPDLLLVVPVERIKVARQHQEHGEGMVCDFGALHNFVVGKNDVAIAQIAGSVSGIENSLDSGGQYANPFEVLAGAHFGGGDLANVAVGVDDLPNDGVA